MLIRYLHYFQTLAREKHFARAAAACHVSQPTLSAAIRKLEEELGAPLVRRTHRFVGLTTEGARVLAWAQQTLDGFQNMQDSLGGSATGLLGNLRLGVVPAAIPAVSIVTGAFCAANPRATVEIRSLTSRAIAEGIEAFELDGGLSYLDDGAVANFDQTPLYRERYQLAVPCGHGLAEHKSMTWQEASEERLCLLGQDMQNRRIVDRVAASVGVHLNPTIVSNSFLAVTAHLRQGGFASIVPHSFFRLLGSEPGLCAIDLIDPVHSEPVGIIVSSREPRSAMVTALMAAAGAVDVEQALQGVDR